MHEEHAFGGEYLKDAVYAANDGIITTFAVVAGVVGAALSPLVILILGFANLLADGFSMATGNYLGSKSERQLYHREREREEKELEEMPEKERQEIMAILDAKGYQGMEGEKLADLIMKNKKFSVDFMMHEELKLSYSDISPLKHALITFITFVVAGLIPLLPFILVSANTTNRFVLAVILTGTALFIVGAIQSLFTKRHWVGAGIEMLLVGGMAATIAYVIGFAVSRVV